MTEPLTHLLERLLADWENEVVEFKEAARQFSVERTGEYVSALSNEANLRGLSSGWLVLGVSNDGQVVGTTHLVETQQRQALKQHIHQSIDQGLTIREIHEVVHEGRRVVMMEVPAAPRGIPISWKGNYRARAGESLVPMSLDKLDEIRRQTIDADWTAVVVPEATLRHLDPAALVRARQGFAERHVPRIPASEIESWDDPTCLAKARLTRAGSITRATLLLLGSDTSTHLLTPHPAELTWKLVGEQKSLPVSPEAMTHLRKAKLVEGRKPSLRISEQIASASGRLADYVRTRPQTDAHYATLVRDYLQRSGSATRQEIDTLLLPLLPEVLSARQKEVKVSNLLAKPRREGSIVNAGTRTQPRWELS